MAFPYKHVLLIGATAGIGRAMATKFLASGVSVTAVGRRTSRLEEFVASHKPSAGSGVEASFETFDINETSKAPTFASSVLSKHPKIDCVFLNAGTQGSHDWSKPEAVDLSAFNAEIHTNFTAMVALTHAFLPLLQSQQRSTSIIFTGTHLSLVPALYLPAYSASKAALHAFILCVREMIRDSAPDVKIIELSPPVVQTELHDYMGEERGRALGMPVNVFTEQAYEGLCGGEETLIVGGLGMPGTDAAKKMTEEFKEMEKLQQSAFGTMSQALKAARH